MSLVRTMRTIDLRENEPSGPVALSVSERDALAAAVPSLAIAPAAGERDAYTLKPGSTVGALEVGGLSVLIRPKLDVRRVLVIASQAMNAVDFRDERFAFGDGPTLVEVLAPAFITASRRAFSRGLLHGYRTEERTLTTVRGRVALAEQLRQRFDIPLPVEACYDEFTDDIIPNRLIRAALARLGTLPIRDTRLREDLRRIEATLANVALVPFTPHDVPTVAFDRLNEHYREVVELSRLVLRHWTFEAYRGEVRASGILMDMNVVFQEFATRALRDELRLSELTFRSDKRAAGTLDTKGRKEIKPDFTWWEKGECVFAGDAKYKRSDDGRVPSPDIYQALAYATALDLPVALLAYADGDSDVYEVRHSDKRLVVATLRLAGTMDDLRESVTELAGRVRVLRSEARGRRRRAA